MPWNFLPVTINSFNVVTLVLIDGVKFIGIVVVMQMRITMVILVHSDVWLKGAAMSLLLSTQRSWRILAANDANSGHETHLTMTLNSFVPMVSGYSFR